MTRNKKVSDFLVEGVDAWGVEVSDGYSGDGINGVLGALGRAASRPRLIQPTHEERRPARGAAASRTLDQFLTRR